MSDWLDGIRASLDTGIGTREQKTEAWEVAKQIDAAELPGWLRQAFQKWVYHYGYTAPPPASVYQGLPFSVLTGNDVPFRNGRPMSMDERTQARERRVRRAKAALADGMPEDVAIALVCSKDEWDESVGRKAESAA